MTNIFTTNADIQDDNDEISYFISLIVLRRVVYGESFVFVYLFGSFLYVFNSLQRQPSSICDLSNLTFLFLLRPK